MSTPDEGLPRLVAALLGTPGLVLAFLWGFAEGTLFFVVPDVCVTLTTALRLRRGLAQVGAVIAGAILAGSVLYGWAASSPRRAQAAVAGVPFVGERMLEETARRLEARGAWAMFERPLGGVPYKVYAVLAPSHLPGWKFLLLSIPARLERLMLSWGPFALLALWLRRIEPRRRWRIAHAIYATFWIVVYGYYWGSRM